MEKTTRIEWLTGEVWFDWDKSDRLIEEQVAKAFAGEDIVIRVPVDKGVTVYPGDPRHSSSKQG